MSFKSLIERIVSRPLQPGVEKIVKHIQGNIDASPLCCSESMEYLGETSGDYLTTQFYQCQICQRVELANKRDWKK